MSITEASGSAVRLVRIIDAPPSAVFRAFVDPDRLRRWFSPAEHDVTRVEVDARVGGRHRTEIDSAEQGRHAFDAEITELVPGERIALRWVFEDLDAPTRSAESLVTITLRDAGSGATELTLVHERLDEESPDGVADGWSEALAKLVALHERSR